MSYLRFGAMIATSTIVMFILMYFNTYVFEHVYFSETRTYMAIVMGAVMAVIMLGFMWGMYKNTAANWIIMAAAVVVFGAALWLVRSQVTVGDLSYMRAMIPHHSIAIMTSKRAGISDPRVRKLADEIIAAQNKEIAEMRYLIHDIEANGDAGDAWPLGTRPAEPATLDEALASAEVAALDLEGLTDEEISGTIGGAASCSFERAVRSPPVLVVAKDGATGVMKLSGRLVRLVGSEEADATDAAVAFETDGARLVVMPTADNDQADLLFELDRGLRVGYAGYWRCAA